MSKSPTWKSHDKCTYLPFQIDKEELTSNPTNILKISKELILNTGKYSKFLNDCNGQAQMNCLKVPEITTLPVLKSVDISAISQENSKYLSRNSSMRNINRGGYENNTMYSQSITSRMEHLSMTPVKKCAFIAPHTTQSNAAKIVLCSSSNENEREKENPNKKIEELIEDMYNMANIMSEYNAVYQIQFFKGNKDQKYMESISFLEDKLNDLSNGICENVTTKKHRSYTTKHGVFLDFSCESICLKFTNKETGKTHKILLPFSILPFFYFSSFSSFLLFLTKIIKMSNDVSHISIDYQAMITYYPIFIKRFKSSHSNFFHEQSILFTNEKRLKQSYDWITSESVYEFTLVLPMMTCTVISDNKSKRVRIDQLMDKELIIHLLKTNFILWDYAILCNFTVQKKFRYIIHSVLNYKSIAHSSNWISMDNPRQFNDIKTWKVYQYFISDDNWQNYYHRIIPLKIKVTANQFKIHRDFFFELNLSETQSALNLASYCKTEEIILKCLSADHQKQLLSLNFDSISGNENNYMYIMKAISNNLKNCIEREDNDYSIEISEPKLEWEEISQENGLMRHEKTINKEMISHFVSVPISEWCMVIKENLTQFLNMDEVVKMEKKISGPIIRRKSLYMSKISPQKAKTPLIAFPLTVKNSTATKFRRSSTLIDNIGKI